jgi:hypothetical protein
MNKIIIAGSRNFNNYSFLTTKMDILLEKLPPVSIIIISGGARGADQLGERYAIDNQYRFVLYEADWDKYGLGAGYRRNEQMAQNATHCVCFWDGKSRGTKHMMDLAQQYKLNLRVYRQQKIYALPEFTTDGTKPKIGDVPQIENLVKRKI